MYTVTVSPKFQVVIPQAIRKSLGLQPGQKLQAILYQDRIELIPIKACNRCVDFLRELILLLTVRLIVYECRRFIGLA